MVDKICDWLLSKIRKEDNDIDDERAEVIYYGLQNMIGELPKGIIVIIVSALLGLFNLVVAGTAVMMIYRGFAGGVHLKTHISCLFTSIFLIIGSAYIAKTVTYINPIPVYTLFLLINFIIVTLYAPADTYNRPIMHENQRIKQKIECYLMIFLVYLLSTFLIKNQIMSSLFIYMITVESLMITPLAYKIFDNQYGEERRKEILKSM